MCYGTLLYEIDELGTPCSCSTSHLPDLCVRDSRSSCVLQKPLCSVFTVFLCCNPMCVVHTADSCSHIACMLYVCQHVYMLILCSYSKSLWTFIKKYIYIYALKSPLKVFYFLQCRNEIVPYYVRYYACIYQYILMYHVNFSTSNVHH